MSQDPFIAGALERAKREADAHQQMQMVLNATMTNPQTLIQHAFAVVGVRDDEGKKVLMIGTPDGTRRDVVIGPDVLSMLKRVLLGELDG